MNHEEKYFKHKKAVVDQALDDYIPNAETRPQRLHQAMRYSVFAGGKRIRAMICLAAVEAVGGNERSALLPAMALEVFHTYTLIHDDLPAMDDDDLRRGQPTCHKAFGEANAILAGDALLTMAFEWVGACYAPPLYPPNQLSIELAKAGGSQGVIAGQVEDMASEGKESTLEQVEYIHGKKTAVLFRVACRMGGIAGGANHKELEALSKYGNGVGLAFQIADDILNETGTEEALGKAVGSDREKNKSTYVTLLGLDEAASRAQESIDQALAALKVLPGPIEPLKKIAHFCMSRSS
ncbi:MAG: polyprenyl synthetase family protein [Kiritimatiellae bacterium]|nr:polyprenyl synthetase family protein [Kiritimatiellia bacterium]